MMIGEAIRAALAAASVLGLLQSWIQCNAFVTTPQAPPPYYASAVTNTAGMAAKTTTSTSRGSSVLRWGRPTFLEMAANGGGGGGKAGGGEKTRVLFVCLGNICRSPTAEAVFKQVTSKAGSAEKFDIDSCGTGGGSPNWYMDEGHSYHEGDSPDARMTAAAAGRGVKLGGGSRPLRPADLEEFDIIVGMDPANTEAISTAAKHWGRSDLAAAKTRTMTSYCRNSPGCKTVPDPYYGGSQGFETVLDLLDDACEGLLEKCLAGEA